MTLQISRNGAVVANDADLFGSPAVRITGANVRFTNKDGGSLFSTSSTVGALVIDGAGAIVTNEAGGEIKAFGGGVAIQGSTAGDRIVDGGSIIGKVRLGLGNDSFTSLNGSPAALVELGGGDDIYRHSTNAAVGAISGGDGYDRMILSSDDGLLSNDGASGFEQLEIPVGGHGLQLHGFSGFEKVIVAPGSFLTFRYSDNPDGDISFAAGSDWGIVSVNVGATFRNITGTAGSESIQVHAGTVLGDISLLGADDSFIYIIHHNGIAPTIGGTVDGGGGTDWIFLSVDDGRTVDLASMTGFERLDAGSFSSVDSDVRLANVDGFQYIQADFGGRLVLAESDSPNAVVGLGFPVTLILESSTIVAQVGEYLNGVFTAENGDPDRSVTVVNRGAILGNVILNLGNDVFDGRLGTVGGVIFGFAGNDSLTGGRGSDEIEGGWGNDRLDGGPGADLLTGGKGHDVYVVDHALDKLVEEGSAGTDTVESAVSYTLPVHFEKLILTGAFGYDGRGNAGANTITGNSGGNFLDGGRGNDVIAGGAGNDRLMGNLGVDTLKGGAGDDRFYFNAAPGSANADRILDFSAADDSLWLLRSAFTRLGPAGPLSASAFHQGPAAADLDDRILYDAATGKIFYDADGSDAGPPALFATVGAGTPLTYADFMIYG